MLWGIGLHAAAGVGGGRGRRGTAMGGADAAA
jgi:hypothetical protein